MQIGCVCLECSIVFGITIDTHSSIGLVSLSSSSAARAGQEDQIGAYSKEDDEHANVHAQPELKPFKQLPLHDDLLQVRFIIIAQMS